MHSAKMDSFIQVFIWEKKKKKVFSTVSTVGFYLLLFF